MAASFRDRIKNVEVDRKISSVQPGGKDDLDDAGLILLLDKLTAIFQRLTVQDLVMLDKAYMRTDPMNLAKAVKVIANEEHAKKVGS